MPTDSAQATTADQSPRFMVTGDVSFDYNLYLPEPDGGRPKTGFVHSLGGGAIIHAILSEASKSQPGSDQTPAVQYIYAKNTLPAGVTPMAGLWKQKDPGKVFEPIKTKPTLKLWRSDQSITLGDAGELAAAMKPSPVLVAKNPAQGNVIIINDDAGQFRCDLPADEWPLILRNTSAAKWVVFKTTAPLCTGDLWWHLVSDKETCERLVVVVTGNDLRRHDVRISEGISWERTAADIARELLHNPALAHFRQARHVVVTLHCEGAVIMSRQGEQRQFRLVFDPARMEREWAVAQEIKGDAYGYTATMTAAVAWGLEGEKPDIVAAVERGLTACRLLRAVGHGPVEGGQPAIPFAPAAELIAGSDTVSWRFGDMELSRKKLGKFGHAAIPDRVLQLHPDHEEGGDWRWRILEHGNGENLVPEGEPLWGMARRLAVFGPGKGLPNVPIAEFGKLVTVDRDEIEALRNVQRLIQGYKNAKTSKPLSLAVFGPPGAGKSFGVTQIAQGVLGPKSPVLTFNLSQFKDQESLIDLFHQVRDKALEGEIPLVFWDEFDSRKLEWLQYFLAPMQDGVFQQGQITHPIGKCIFVFAGATSHSYAKFIVNTKTPEAVALKGPDFASRLAGYINVLGPNQRQDIDGERDPLDVCYPVRRALLLRSWAGLVGDKRDQRLDIDAGLLAALLEVRSYAHGSRSMERIVRATIHPQSGRLARAALPPDELLQLDTDHCEFLGVISRSRTFEIFAEELAPFIHGHYCNLVKQQGSEPNAPFYKAFAELSAWVKGDNIAAARRIPWILGLAGLYLVRGEPDPEEAKAVEQVLKTNIAMLAEEEHDLWMQLRVTNGWTYGTRSESLKQNPRMVPFAELDPENLDKDRDAVMKYPKIAELAGCRITRRMPIVHDLK